MFLSCFWRSVNALSLGEEPAHRRRRYGRSRFVKHPVAPATFVNIRHLNTSMLRDRFENNTIQ
jgi:hypothetical protein